MTNDLRDLLVNVIRLAIAPDSPRAALWTESARAAQGRLATSASREEAHLDGIWNMATAAAADDADVQRDEVVNPTLPTTCPLTYADLVNTSFGLDDAVEIVRTSASSG